MSALPVLPTCPTVGGFCRHACNPRCRIAEAWGAPRPIDLLGQPEPAVHFVGFRGDEYHSAVRVFGPPDFVHRVWDVRAASEIGEHDVVVFARYYDQEPSPYSYDDSNQPDDPAAAERRER